MKYGVWVREPWPGDKPADQFWMTGGASGTRLEYDSPGQAEKALAEAFPNGVPPNMAVQPIERVYAIKERGALPVTQDAHEFWHTDQSGRIEYDTADQALAALQQRYPDGVPGGLSVEAVTPTSPRDGQKRAENLAQAEESIERWPDKDNRPIKTPAKPPVKSFEQFIGQGKARKP